MKNVKCIFYAFLFSVKYSKSIISHTKWLEQLHGCVKVQCDVTLFGK